MKAKNLWFIVLIMAFVGLVGAIGYLFALGKYVIATGVLCLGVLAFFAAKRIVKEILTPDPPKVDEFTQKHTSKH